ncbi:MAG: sulfite exporter TauE/SafE family protein [Candidatus Obscuribacter sp.]|nr:sulfite exporter TauE/SafE family protein [Candidatus Obscuribacter sp.]
MALMVVASQTTAQPFVGCPAPVTALSEVYPRLVISSHSSTKLQKVLQLTEITQILLITFVAFIATMMSSICGAGSSLITTPVWLMLGYPLPVAIASNTVSGSFWTLVAARNFLRGHEID